MCRMILTPPSGCCMPVAVLARRKHDSSFPSDPPLPEVVMHNDIHPNPKAKYMPGMEQTHLPRQHRHRAASLRCTRTLLPRNLCKWQKQNVALQLWTTRDRPSDLRDPSPALQLA